MDPAADPPNAAEAEVPEVDAAHRVIDRVSVKDLTSLRFLKDYAAANRPLILLDVVSSWRCWTDWRNEDGTAKLQELGEEFAGFEGPLTNCTTGEQDTWDIGTFFNCLAAGQGCDGLYLKDWHFVHTYQSKGQEAPYNP
eukprot:symbB.v1.2.020641.t1/scaffold1750.1/size103142/1